MLIMAIAFWLYAIATALARTRILIREREAQSAWIDSLEEQT
jgi:heme exporter protein C